MSLMMKHRRVVSNFFFRERSSSKEERLVALFRRSRHPDVRSYQGKLAPIAGSVDSQDVNILTAAYREIKEETQLEVMKDYELEFIGKPFTFEDDVAGRSWTVHPFSWILKADDEKIQLDWEHDGWEWVKPQHVLDGSIADQCVPQLDESLKRIFFGPTGMFPGRVPLVTRENTAGQTFLSTLRQLRSDKQSGARVLATNSIKGLAQMVRDFGGFPADENLRAEWWNSLKVAAYHLAYSGRPSMNAAISSSILRALYRILPQATKEEADFARIDSELEAIIAQREQMPTRIAESLVSYVESLESETPLTNGAAHQERLTIVTLSSSSTIEAALLNLVKTRTNLTVDLHILESRPQCEGVLLAANLLKSAQYDDIQARLRISVSPDSHAALLTRAKKPGTASPCIVLLGSDRISPSGHVLNKTGSTIAAVTAKTLNPHARVVVLSEEDKIAAPVDVSVYASGEEDVDQEMYEHVAELSGSDEVSKIWQVAGALSRSEQAISDNDIEIHNVYFEWVPRDFVDVYVSENETLTRDEIRAKSLGIANLEEKMFGDLYTKE